MKLRLFRRFIRASDRSAAGVHSWGMRRLLPLTLLTLCFATACGDLASSPAAEEEWPEPTWPELRSEQPHDADPLLDADEELGFARDHRLLALDLYHQTRQSLPGENLMLSPYSLRTAFAMLYGGSVGLAREQLRDTLHFSLDGERQHVAFNWLDDQLRARALPEVVNGDRTTDEVIVAPANAVWVSDGLAEQIEQPYVDLLSIHYDSGLRLADFSEDREGERTKINAWVEARTRGLIPELIKEFPEVVTMVLVNALYIKAPWAEPFDPNATGSGPFTRLDGTVVDVDMMSAPAGISVAYAEDVDYQAVSLPLRGRDLELVVILPTGDFASFEDSLDEARLAAILAGLESAFWNVRMPRLSVASRLRLKQPLQALGMTEPFKTSEPVEPFSEIGLVGNVFEVYHDVNVILDEGGVEAAAATAVVLEEEGGGGGPDDTITINRPFFLMIRDRPTDTLLFFGRVLDPSAG